MLGNLSTSLSWHRLLQAKNEGELEQIASIFDQIVSFLLSHIYIPISISAFPAGKLYDIDLKGVKSISSLCWTNGFQEKLQ